MRFCHCGTKYRRRCPKCQPNGHTKSTTERGYGWDHQQVRQHYYAKHPLCEACVMKDVLTARTTADIHHIEKIADSPHKRLKTSNWLALCKHHHDRLEHDQKAARDVKQWSVKNYAVAMGA